jgi:hypothetical protein
LAFVPRRPICLLRISFQSAAAAGHRAKPAAVEKERFNYSRKKDSISCAMAAAAARGRVGCNKMNLTEEEEEEKKTR